MVDATTPLRDGHLDDEAVGAYVEGSASPELRRDIERHIAHCPQCFEIVSELAHVMLPDAKVEPSRRWHWIGWSTLAAAAILLGVRLMTGPSTSVTDDPLADARMRLAAGSTAWPLDARLAGFPYLAPAARTRSGEPATQQDWELRATAQEVEEQYATDPRAAARHATAIALLVAGRIDEAITELDALVDENANDVDALNDLGVALLSRGRGAGGVSDLARSRITIERARSLEPSRPDVIYNQALILEALADRAGAERAWREYLALDSSSPFAAQANIHLRTLRGTTP